MKKPDHFTIAQARAAIRADRLPERDRRLLGRVARAGAVEFTYAPRGKHARLVDSTGHMTTRDRRRLRELTKLGYLTERLHGCFKTVNHDSPEHVWEFRLTAAGREAIKLKWVHEEGIK